MFKISLKNNYYIATALCVGIRCRLSVRDSLDIQFSEIYQITRLLYPKFNIWYLHDMGPLEVTYLDLVSENL